MDHYQDIKDRIADRRTWVNDDRDHYIIKCRVGSDVVVMEVDDFLTRERVVDLIRSGEFERVVQIVQYNTGHCTSLDITEEIAREVADAAGPAGTICRSALAFIETHASFGLANEVRMVAEVA